jgi:hypothetical protein
MRLELAGIVPGARHAGDRNKRAHRLTRQRAAKRDSEIKRYRERGARVAVARQVNCHENLLSEFIA